MDGELPRIVGNLSTAWIVAVSVIIIEMRVQIAKIITRLDRMNGNGKKQA